MAFKDRSPLETKASRLCSSHGRVSFGKEAELLDEHVAGFEVGALRECQPRRIFSLFMFLPSGLQV